MPSETAPRTVRAAAVLTTLQAAVGFTFLIALVVRGASGVHKGVGTLSSAEIFGQAGYFSVLSAAVLTAGIGLWCGKLWARTPVLLVQLLLLCSAWYAMVPSEQPLLGVGIAVTPAVVLWLLFNRRGRQWAFAESTAPDARPEQR